MKNKNNLAKSEMIAILKIVVGCFLYSLSVVLFIDPVQIIPGSVTGIGVVVKALTGFPIGALNLIVNIPLVIWGTIVLGKRLLIYTGLTVVLNSVMMDGLAFLPAFTQDVLLASIFGGIVMGVGLGLILDAGGSTGGTSVVGHLVTHKKPDLPMGDILMIGDFIIIVAGSIFLKDWNLMLYSIIDLYVCVIVINKVMYGYKVQSLSVICTKKAKEIAEEIQETMRVKIISIENEQVVVASKKGDVSKIQRIAQKIDTFASCESFDASYTFGDLYQNREEKNYEITGDYK